MRINHKLFLFIIFIELSFTNGIRLLASNEAMYVTDPVADRIVRIDTDGLQLTNVITTDLIFPLDIKVDSINGKMYWTDIKTFKLERANLDGSQREVLFIGNANSYPRQCALDLVNNEIYWGEYTRIMKSSLDGSNIEELIFLGNTSLSGLSLDISNGKIYWSDWGSYKIQRANLDGSSIEHLLTTGSNLAYPGWLTLDLNMGKMYWGANDDTIHRANLDGSDPEAIITNNLENPAGLTINVNDNKLYWARLFPNSIQRMDLSNFTRENVLNYPEGGDFGFRAIAFGPIPKPPILLDIKIVGPNKVVENSVAQYQAIAFFNNNSTQDVTEKVFWSVEPGTFANIDDTGMLNSRDIEKDAAVTLRAEYTKSETVIIAEKEIVVRAICPDGYALQFDGQNDSVNCGDSFNLDINDSVSISAHVRFNSLQSFQTIIAKRGAETDKNSNYALRTGHITQNGEDELEFYYHDGSNWHIYATTNANLTVGKWYHIAVTFVFGSGTSVRCYVDNTLVSGGWSRGTGNSPVQINTNPVTIGGLTNNEEVANGTIDEVAIYNMALASEEIQAMMYQPLEGNEPGLVAYWNFDEGAGQVAGDLSGNGNDGRLGNNFGDDGGDPVWVESDAPVGLCVSNNVSVDIKPGSCPNPLNLKSQGILPVAILGSADFDVATIDVASLRLADVAPIRSDFEDVAAPLTEPNECKCAITEPDGFTDLTLKFKTQEIVEVLFATQNSLAKGQTLTLPLDGKLLDGTSIAGTDCVALVGNVSKWLEAQAADINQDDVINLLDLTELVTYWLETSKSGK